MYICVDFNFDLLKIETDNITLHFFNFLCYQTKVTENTDTVIDNIFSNNIQGDIISGNILLTLSEHFSQFVKREKSINIILNFQQKVFKTMSQFKTGVILMIMFMIHSWICIINLKGL